MGGNPAASWLGLAAHNASQAGVAVVETAAGRLMRAYGPLPHPNMFGGFAVIGLLAAFRAVPSRLRFGLLAVAGSALALSFSRSAAIGAVLTGAWLLWRLRKQAVPAIAAACVGIALTVIPFAPSFMARADAGNRLEQASVNERVSQLKEWATVFLKNPITGVGPGNYTAVLVVRDAKIPAWASQPVHNILLLALAELGFLGFFAFLSVIGPKAWMTWKESDAEIKTWSIAFALALLPIAFFDHYLWSLWPGMSLVAVTVALIFKQKQES
jgi:O-antigen ligase